MTQLLTITGDKLVSPCGKLHFIHFEGKTISQFLVNIYLEKFLDALALWFLLRP